MTLRKDIILEIITRARTVIEDQTFNYKEHHPQEFSYIHLFYSDDPWHHSDGCNVRLRCYQLDQDSYKTRIEFGFLHDLPQWNCPQMEAMNKFLDTYAKLHELTRQSNRAFEVVYKEFDEAHEEKLINLSAAALAKITNDMRKLVSIINNGN